MDKTNPSSIITAGDLLGGFSIMCIVGAFCYLERNPFSEAGKSTFMEAALIGACARAYHVFVNAVSNHVFIVSKPTPSN